MLNRLINYSKSNSFFLFGPRGTGKSTFLRKVFPESEYPWIDLLNSDLERVLSRRPQTLEEFLSEIL